MLLMIREKIALSFYYSQVINISVLAIRRPPRFIEASFIDNWAICPTYLYLAYGRTLSIDLATDVEGSSRKLGEICYQKERGVYSLAAPVILIKSCLAMATVVVNTPGTASP